MHASNSRVPRPWHPSPWKEVHTLGSDSCEAEHSAAQLQIVFQVLNLTFGDILSWHCCVAKHGFLPWS